MIDDCLVCFRFCDKHRSGNQLEMEGFFFHLSGAVPHQKLSQGLKQRLWRPLLTCLLPWFAQPTFFLIYIFLILKQNHIIYPFPFLLSSPSHVPSPLLSCSLPNSWPPFLKLLLVCMCVYICKCTLLSLSNVTCIHIPAGVLFLGED